MAFEHVTAVLHGLFGVDPSTKLVMVIIADHTRRDSGVAWPTIATIARLASLSTRHVQTIVSEMREQGWLVVDAGEAGRAGRGGNRYRLSMARLIEVRRKNSEPRSAIHDSRKSEAQCVLPAGEMAKCSAGIANSAARNSEVEGGEIANCSSPDPVLIRYEPVLDPAETPATAGPQTRSGTERKASTPEPEHSSPTHAPAAAPPPEEFERRRQAALAGLKAFQKKVAGGASTPT